MTSNDAGTLSTLHIDIRDGWAGECLLVLVNGQPVFESAVSTRPQIGLADQTELAVPAGTAIVEAVVTGRDLRASLEVYIDGGHWVGISLRHDAIEIVGQNRLFGYV
jgi:hypothetical protein